MIDNPYALVGLTDAEIEAALETLPPDNLRLLIVRAVLALQENQERAWRDGYEAAVENFYEALGALTDRYFRREGEASNGNS